MEYEPQYLIDRMRERVGVLEQEEKKLWDTWKQFHDMVNTGERVMFKGRSGVKATEMQLTNIAEELERLTKMIEYQLERQEDMDKERRLG